MMTHSQLLYNLGYTNYQNNATLVAAMRPHPELQFEVKFVPESGMPYCIVSPVLAQPNMLKSRLKRYPIHDSYEKSHTSLEYIKAFRQRLNSIEFEPILDTFGDGLKALAGMQDHVRPNRLDWHLSTSTYFPGIGVNMIPHHDSPTVSANLFLSEGMETSGTGFYALKIDGKKYYRYSDLNTPELIRRYEEIDAECIAKPFPWKPWEENEYWELIHTIPGEYNTAVIYQGEYFHHGIYEERHWDYANPRYTMVAFLWNLYE